MSSKKTQEFEDVVKDILYFDKFRELDHELHHGISRYGHSIRVAKVVYKIAKRFHWKYEEITRAALLHDFYFDDQLKDMSILKTWSKHPEYALLNAKQHFEINELQENLIISHMFPTCKALPKYKESWLVSFVDKGVSLYEMYRFKASLVLGVWAIFLFNMITLQK